MTEMVEATINKRWTLKLPEHRAARGDWWDTWEQERLASMADHIGEGDLVYYIGAEQGDMPALCASWGADTVLVEPVPEVWPTIRSVFKANDLPTPKGCYAGFAGANDYRAEGSAWPPGSYGWPPESDGAPTDFEGFANSWERPDICCSTIDTLRRRFGPPTAISIDVEGAELGVLQGAWRTLRHDRPKIWLSLHRDEMLALHHAAREDVFTLLIVEHGYVGTLLADDHEQHWSWWPKGMG